MYEPSGNRDKCKAILITRNNQLPYKPVTRLQYLKTTKEVLEIKKKKEIDIQIKMQERTEAEQAVAKQKGWENALIGAKPNRVEERTANYLKRYRTDRQLKEESVQREEKYYNDLIKPIDDVWNSLDKEALKEPAIVDATNILYKFKGFTTQEKGGRMIVFVNADYFNLKLPKYVPQFIVLYWEWDKNAPAQNFKKQLEENFSTDQMKAMIDK